MKLFLNTLTTFGQWFSRDRITLLIAMLLLLASAVSKWYLVPPATLQIFHAHLYLSALGRGIAIIFAIVSSVYCILGRISLAPRLPTWLGLGFAILFPFLFTTWAPGINYIASEMLKQQQEATGHIELNFPFIQSEWKQQMTLLPSSVIDTVAPFRIGNTRFFQVASFQDILTNGLGYRNSFFALIGPGWGCFTIGIGTMLMAHYSSLKQQSFQRLFADLKRLRLWLSLTLCIVALTLFMPNLLNTRLERAFSLGQYQTVIRQSRWITSIYPPLAGDTQFLVRLAAAGYYANQLAPGQLTFLQGVQSYSDLDYLRAEQAFQSALNADPKQFLTRGYLATTQLNRGIEYFNENKMSEAIAQFERVLENFPMHVSALYYLMLAYSNTGDFNKSALIGQQLSETQDYFQISSPSITGQATLHSAWSSFHENNMDRAWQKYHESIK